MKMTKKLIGILLACLMLMALMTVSAFADDILYGDANGDGNVDAKDAILLQQYIAEWDVSVEAGGDANGDGNIDAKDAILMQQYIAEWEVTLGPDTPAHTCEYVATETKAATCGEAGIMTYTCECGESYTEEIPATGEHEFFNDCETVCINCYQEVREASHTVIHVEAVAPTCTTMGNIEFWYCEVCGQAWLDAECTLNTNMMAVKLPATGEHVYDDEYDADCNECGEEREVEEKIYNDGQFGSW